MLRLIRIALLELRSQVTVTIISSCVSGGQQHLAPHRIISRALHHGQRVYGSECLWMGGVWGRGGGVCGDGERITCWFESNVISLVGGSCCKHGLLQAHAHHAVGGSSKPRCIC